MTLHLLILCCSLLLSDAEHSIHHPFTSTCAVAGSSLTLPCTFTPVRSVIDGGRTVYLKVVRVVWCKNHDICHGNTPTVYDSNSTTKMTPGFQYLGDLESNCTLLINNIKTVDAGTFRFRVEGSNVKGHFTNRTGVKVTVADQVQMEVSRSGSHTEVSRGGTVTLSCTSRCTAHQLEVTWYRDGHALPESGPALQLGPLTAGHSGNYTCELKGQRSTASQPYSLKVEDQEDQEDQEGPAVPRLAADVLRGFLVAGVPLVALAVFARSRMKQKAAKDSGAEENQE